MKRKRQRGRDREEETERKKVSERATEGGESEEGGGAPLKRGEARVVAEALPEGVHLRRRRGRGGVGTAGAGAGRRRGPSWVGDAQGHEGPSTRCTNVDVTKNATVREMSVLDTLVECVGRVGQRADCLWFSPGVAAGCASRG